VKYNNVVQGGKTGYFGELIRLLFEITFDINKKGNGLFKEEG